MQTITWQTTDGRAVEVRVYQRGLEAIAEAIVGGKRITSGVPELLDTPIRGAIASLGNLGMVRERYDEVMAAINALQAEIDEQPEVKLEKLTRQRERLAESLKWAQDDAYQAEHDRIEHCRRTGIATARVDHTATVTKAREALAAFDAGHPEIGATLKADRAARTARHMWD